MAGAFRGGDRRAFAELVRVHGVRVRALLVRLVASRDDADDLLQEVFVRAWKRREQFDGRGSVEGWLLRIAVNLARDHGRAKRRPTDPLDAERDVDRGAGPEGHARGRELTAALRASLARLPHRLRAALVLRVVEERPYDEVARILGLAPGTVRIQVMKARRRLAAELAPWLEGGES
ncbi:MAG: sigma-70 family RNA polymerase sigma factor [Planctomycetota bacterium]